MRIGIDLGGTKIEAAALDARRRGAGAPPHRRRPPATTPRRSPRSATLVGDDRGGELGRRGTRRRRHARARSRRPPAWSRTPIRPGSTAARFDRDLERGARPRRCASPTTPTASPSPRRPTARPPAPPPSSASSSAPGSAAASSSRGRLADRRQRDRRRMGPQPAALAGAMTSGRGRPAIAASAAASRPSSPVPGSPPTIGQATGEHRRRGR